jgi:hypothetical protein
MGVFLFVPFLAMAVVSTAAVVAPPAATVTQNGEAYTLANGFVQVRAVAICALLQGVGVALCDGSIPRLLRDSQAPSAHATGGVGYT